MPLKASSRRATNEGLSAKPQSLPEIVPDAYRAVSGVEAYIRGCGLIDLWNPVAVGGGFHLTAQAA